MINRIQAVGRQKALDVNRAVIFGAQFIQLVHVDHDVLTLCVFVAAYDFVRAEFAVLRTDFLVLHPIIAFGVQLIQSDIRPGRVGGERPDRH